MKKIFALLICFVFASACAFASELPQFPFEIPGENNHMPAAPSDVSEAVRVNVHGQTLTLGFDPSKDFSYIENGLVQASFYAYGPDGKYLYELYMTYPETVTAGSVFTQDLAVQAGLEACSVVMLISTGSTEDLYVAAQYNGSPYPQGTSYTIRFDSVSETSGGRLYAGSVSASMVGEDISGAPISEKLIIADAPFSFTLPTGTAPVNPSDSASPVPHNTPSPAPYDAPLPYNMPSPTPTVRTDMFRI